MCFCSVAGEFSVCDNIFPWVFIVLAHIELCIHIWSSRHLSWLRIYVYFGSYKLCWAVLSRSIVSDSLQPQAPVSMGILQARILEWVAICFSRGFSQPRDWTQVSRIAAASAKSLQSCPTLCYPIDGSPTGSLVPGILQARTLEWVAISFSNAWKWKVKVKSLSCVRLLATPMDCSLPGSPVHGIFQARVLEWVAIAFSTPALQAGSLLSEPQWTRATRSIYFVLQKVAL